MIEVRDDGKGLNRAKLLKKARERGMDVHDGMTDQEVYSLILAPGFSTAEVVTDVSGRGVGMDVVKKNITALGGTVEIDSAEGYGMTVRCLLYTSWKRWTARTPTKRPTAGSSTSC